jgi:RHS repeat-associated protein
VSGDKNKYLFNDGAERQEDLGLNIDLTLYRAYDPAIGRWWQVDPKADLDVLVSWTPYNYSFNNPIRWNDPLGDCPPNDPNCNPIVEKVKQVDQAIAEMDPLGAIGEGLQAIGEAIGVVDAKIPGHEPGEFSKEKSDTHGEAYFKTDGGKNHGDSPRNGIVDGKNDMTVLTSTLSPGHPNLPTPTVEGFVKAITTVADAVKVGEIIVNGVNALPEANNQRSVTSDTVYVGSGGVDHSTQTTWSKVVVGGDTMVIERPIKNR